MDHQNTSILDNAVLANAVQFFKSEAGFHRLLNAFIKRYQSLGRIGGSVRLANPTYQEQEAISRLLRKDLSSNKSITVKLSNFEQELENTKFAGILLKDLLDGYAGYEIFTKTEMQKRYEEEKDNFLQHLAGICPQLYCRQWLEHIQTKGAGTRGIHQAYDDDPQILEDRLKNVLKALARLPSPGTGKDPAQFQRLPVFANGVTCDPHGLDLDTAQGRFFIAALQFIRSQQDDSYLVGSSPAAEEINELLGYFGIIRDDLLNFVTCAGILAFDAAGAVQKMWNNAWQSGAVMNVPLRELVKSNAFMPGISCTAPEKQKVIFVVENSGVFSEVADCFTDRLLPPLVCTHGQAKLATLLLLDRLAANGTTIFYSGDFDPEGLQMAQRLARRYGENLKLWRYDAGDYEESISEVVLSPERLKKLNGINLPGIIQVKDRINSTHRAGYQEYLVPRLVEDIRKYI